MDNAKIAETTVVDELVRKDIMVSMPVHYDTPYDLVADINGKLVKVQVKCCHRSKNRPNTLKCDLRRRQHTAQGMREDTYSLDEVDFYAVYWPEQEEVFWIPFEDAPKKKMNITVEDNNTSGPSPKRLVEDYKIESRL